MNLQLCSALSYSILVKEKLFVLVYLWQFFFLVVLERLTLFRLQWWYFHIVNNTLYCY